MSVLIFAIFTKCKAMPYDTVWLVQCWLLNWVRFFISLIPVPVISILSPGPDFIKLVWVRILFIFSLGPGFYQASLGCKSRSRSYSVLSPDFINHVWVSVRIPILQIPLSCFLAVHSFLLYIYRISTFKEHSWYHVVWTTPWKCGKLTQIKSMIL